MNNENHTENRLESDKEKYMDKNGNGLMHTKCGTAMLLKTSLGSVPFCEKCACYVTKPQDYQKFDF